MCVKGKWRQFGYALIVSSALISGGAVIGWSVEVPRLNDPPNALKVTLKAQDWLVASPGLAALISSIFAGWLIEFIGPCRMMQCIILPAAASWIIMATSDSYWWILIGRILTGCYLQLVMIAIIPFLAEISQSDIRGSLLCFPDLIFSFGVLVMYILSGLLTWQNGTLITGILMIPVAALLLYVPESPYWCIRRGRYKDALRSLQKLRPFKHDMDSEMKNIKDVIADGREKCGTFKDQIRNLKEPANYRPTILLCGLFILRELSGALMISIYAPYFFAQAGVPMTPYSCAILVCITRLLFTLVAVVIIDITGRRALFISSSFICCFMMCIISFILQYPRPFLSWVPLIAVIVFIASYGLGVGPIPWVLIGEILPTPTRTAASTLCNVIFCLTFYLQAFLFPYLVAEFGLGKLGMLFSFFNFLTAIILWLYLPETRNRTLEDLQTAFVGPSLQPFKKQREGYIQPYGATFPARNKLTP